MKQRIEIVKQPFIVRWGHFRGVNQTPPSLLSFHPLVEIQLIKGGKGCCLIGGQRLACERNSLLVIPSNTPHLFAPEPLVPGEKWVVMFRPSLLRAGAWHLPSRFPRVLHLDEAAAEEIESVLRILLVEYERHRACRAECIAAALRYLVALIRRSVRAEHVPPPQNPIVAWVITCVEKRYRDALSLSSLAAESGYSLYYLAHIFKRCTGMSIRQYLLQRRVAEARRLLAEEPALTVAAVAERTGFGSYRVFCHAFRKFVRMPPAAYRRTTQHADGRA